VPQLHLKDCKSCMQWYGYPPWRRFPDALSQLLCDVGLHEATPEKQF
jgi:hypothetical protein